MTIKDTIFLAYRTVRTNKLRTAITVTTIALGLTALIGINTAIQAVENKFTESFSAIGASGFSIRLKERNFSFNGGGSNTSKEKVGSKKEKVSYLGRPITRKQAEAFKKEYPIPASVAISLFGSGNAIITYESKKSNPNYSLVGGDENYLELNGYNLQEGRNISDLDVQGARNICLVGKTIVDDYFKGVPANAIGKNIRVNDISLQIVGTLEEKGSIMGRNFDKTVVITYPTSRQYFNTNPNASYNIGVKIKDIKQLEPAVDEAQGLFRKLRTLPIDVADNFYIDKSDSLTNMLMGQLAGIRIAAVVIGILTLFSASINLMNIMLVAVTERTKEIGLIKAIGGKSFNVQNQFLLEAVIISLMGAAFGIVFGVLLGNLIGLLLNTSLIIPWNWVVAGIFICSVVGLLAGLHPARKAGRLNPIQALRYE
ncbi:ABC transporter permease [Gynurincola endophyticus]|uniref:ABC transporter permease n=1 Tax=Gynurincola endophyticus TaxID=2479004 RepID=UPI000F8ECC99|nr:ABC transporter permease [Gynurincola endophyticus]